MSTHVQYEVWCHEEGTVPVTKGGLTNRMKKLGYKERRTRNLGRTIDMQLSRKLTLLACLVLTFVAAAPVRSEGVDARMRDVRVAALKLMGASLAVPGIAAYCQKLVEPNPQLIQAASNWNGRNHTLMLRILDAIRLTGGLSSIEKEAYDKEAYAGLIKGMEEERDKESFCREVPDIIASGQMDLDRRADLKGPLHLVLEATEK